MPGWTRRRIVSLAAAAPLVACGGDAESPRPIEGTLEWALSGDWRIDPQRDEWRHPLETLRFWGLGPGMTVLEVYPGVGWWTSILAPYLRYTDGRLIVAEWPAQSATRAQRATMRAFAQRFADIERFGVVEHTELSSTSGRLAPANSVDLVIVARNVHTLMAGGFAEKAFREIAACLKPNGFLGVEQHRASSIGIQDPVARSGYVQEAYVKALAAEAGLDFVAAADINANPQDDRDHPFGVWTLPPTLRTSPVGQPQDPNFDSGPYRAVGESDRMTLKFRRPAASLDGIDDQEAKEP
jgi:predicted methyltransferase